MLVRAKLSRLRQTAWWEYLVRFAFGGVVTVITGVIASKFGPAIGGLFLAFPGIFPSSVTLVERHEAQKKRKAGFPGSLRGREVAGVVAAGAALGSIGLLAFAVFAWRAFPSALSAGATLALAALAWMLVSVAAWALRRQL
ncbi:MAG: DUF3147 family protein [Clostridia bacterium]